MRFSAVLGCLLLGFSTFIFGSDARLRDCQISVAMADGGPLPLGLQVSLFDGDRRITEHHVPKTGIVTLAQLRPGDYRIQVAGTERSFVTSGPLRVNDADPCDLGIDLPARADSQNKVAEGEVDVEDLRVSGKTRALFESSFFAFQQGRLDKAKEGFLEVIRIDPKLSRAYDILGVILNQQGDRAAARNFFETSLQLNPRSRSTLLNLAKLSLFEQRYQEVLQLMGRYSQGTRDIANTHVFKAEAYFGLGKFEQVADEARAAHALPHANGADVHLLAAKALEILHRSDSAVEEYRLYLAESKTDESREFALARIRDLTSSIASGAPPVPGNAFMSH